MDYEDNDFQSQGFQLAVEEGSKFSPVSHSYSLPKFDLDDSLQVHLRFDNLVESEGLLGIQSQEEDQWIEDFSREGSGLEFSSGAVESCSISRPHNVWSEATSSESVDLLLKSVGQDEMVMGKPTIEKPDNCNGLGSLKSPMQPSVSQETKSPSKTEVDTGVGSAPAVNGPLEQDPRLDVVVVNQIPPISSTSQKDESEQSISGGLGVESAIEEKGGCLLRPEDDKSEENKLVTDSRIIETIPSPSMKKFVNAGESHNDVPEKSEDKANAEGLEDHLVTSGVVMCQSHVANDADVDTDDKNVENLSSTLHKDDYVSQNTELSCDDVVTECTSQASEIAHLQSSKDTVTADQFIGNPEEASLVTMEVKNTSDVHSADIRHKTELLDTHNTEMAGVEQGISVVVICQTHQENQVDTVSKNVGNLSSPIQKVDCVSENTRLSSDSIVTKNTSQSSDYVDCRSLNDVDMVDQFMGNPQGTSFVMKEESTSVAHSVDVSDDSTKNLSVQIMHVSDQTMEECGNVELGVKPRGLFEIVGDQSDEKGLISNTEGLPGEEKAVLEPESNKNGERCSSSDRKMCPLTDITHESQNCEDTKVGDDGIGVHSADTCSSSPLLVDSQQIETGLLPTNSEPTGVVSEVVQLSSNDLLDGDRHTLVRSNAREEAIQQEVPDSASNIHSPHLLEQGETGIGISILDTKENSRVSNDCILSSESEHGRTCDDAEAAGVVNLNTEQRSPKQLNESSVRTLSQLDESPVISDLAPVETEITQVCKNSDNSAPKETEGIPLSGRDSTCPEALSGDDTGGHVLEAESSFMNTSEPNCGSPTIISCSEASQSEKAPQMGSTQSLDHSDSVASAQYSCKGTHDIAHTKGNDLSEDDRSFTFKVSSQGDLSKKESISGWNPFPSLQSHDIPQGVDCSGTSTPGLCKTDPKMIEAKISGEGNASASCTLEDLSGSKDVRTDEVQIANKEKSDNNELFYSGKEHQEVGRSVTNIAVSHVIDRGEGVVQDPKEIYAAEVGRDVFSKVIPVTNLLAKGTSPKWKPVHTVQSHESPRPAGVSSPMSSTRQIDFKVPQESSRKCSPQTSGAKGARRKEDRKRSSLKASDKENIKEGKVKEITRHTKVEGSNSSGASAGVIQAVQAGETRVSDFPEGSRTKSSAVPVPPASSLPDLNSSASSYTSFQQPFTDSQQVQLRAQIFVYGSIIQGSAPDEACMLAAFSESDGGRNAWENVWRIALERLRSQKSPLINIKTPVQHTGSRASEATRQSIHRSEPLSTHSGVDSIKFPPVVFNPAVTHSSPIWSLSTASRDGLHSSSTPKGHFVDSSKASHPLQTPQSPHTLQYVGNSGSWLSQVSSPGTWAVTPPVTVTVSAQHPKLPVSETVRVTSVRESSAAHRSVNQHLPPSSLGLSGSPPIGPDNTLMRGTKRTTASASKHASTESKSRKKNRSLTFEELGQISSFGKPRMIPVSVTAQPPTYAVTTTITSGTNLKSSSVTSESLPGPVSSVQGHVSSHVQLRGDSFLGSAQSPASVSTTSGACPMDVGSGKIISQSSSVSLEEMSGRIEQSKRQAEDAAAFSATAVGHCQSIWSQLAIQKKSGMGLDLEAKLRSSAVAIAAATSVAKAAAAVAKVASEAALQAKLMADEAMITSKYGNPIPETNFNDDVKSLGLVTPSSILKGRDQTGHADSVFVAVREAARKRVEAASAATKRAENLDAVLKAAEMTAEAVSQAGTIIAMGEPLPFTLTDLVDAGPEGYWKVKPNSSEQLAKSSNSHAEQTSIDGPKKSNNDYFEKCNEESLNKNEASKTGELLKNSAENTKSLVNALQRGSLSSSENVLEVPKTIGVFAESQVTSENAAHVNAEPQLDRTSMENKFEEGSSVEVCSDEDGLKMVWFSAKVLSLKDGKAFVSYAEHARREGSSQHTEWVPLEDKGGYAPRIRPPHPLSVLKYEGTKKRSRDARGDYNTWYIGDKVDAWIRNGWWEGVITEKSKEDETNLTVHFPAQRETTIVRAWNLRPSLIWEDGKWIEWCRPVSIINNEGGTPQEKPAKKSRLVGENDPVMESKGKSKISKLPSIMELAKTETPKAPLMLSANEKVFNAGKTTTKVNFGVPKPGRKRKYMDVSDRGTSTIPKPIFKTGKTQPQPQPQSSEPHSIKRKPTSVAAPNKTVAFGKSVPNNNNSSEPRRSNRRIQPTSRLLEGLQSSLAPTKIPSASSHDKSARSQQKTITRGGKTG